MRIRDVAVPCALAFACSLAAAQQRPSSSHAAESDGAAPGERRLELVDVPYSRGRAAAAESPPRRLEIIDVPATLVPEPAPSAGNAAAPEPPVDGAGIGNRDIVEMVEAQFSEATIRAAIAANAASFDVSPQALVALKQAGVPEQVIEAMLVAEAAKKGAASASAPAADVATAVAGDPPGVPATPELPPETIAALTQVVEQLTAPAAPAQSGDTEPTLDAPVALASRDDQSPRAWVAAGSKKVELVPAMAQVAVTDTKGSGPTALNTLQDLAGTAMSFASPAFELATGIRSLFKSDDPKTTAVWALLGASSARNLGKGSVFEIEFADIPGVNPDDFKPAIVQLVPTRDNYRIVGAAKTKLSEAEGVPTGPVIEESVAAKLTQLERGRYRVSLHSAVPPGEYALVLRPVPKKGRRRNEPETLGDLMGETGGDIFYMTWDFSIGS